MAGNTELAVHLVGWRDRRGRFAALSPQARARVRSALKAQIRTLRDAAKDESPFRQRTPGRNAAGKSTQAGAQGKHFRDLWQTDYTETDSGATARLFNTAPYAQWVLGPTRAHTIRARQARALAFPGKDGRTHFARSVRHPGTKGNPVLNRVLDHHGDSVKAELSRVAADVRYLIEGVFGA